jgi:predicted permease
MSWIADILRRRAIYSDLAEEMRLHLEERTEQLMREGMSRKEAEQAARRAFGNRTLLEERCREVWQWPTLESIWADVRFALRQLRKSPGFTAVALLTLALGVGANTAIFTVVNTVLLKPLSYPDADRIVQFLCNYSGGNNSCGSIPEFQSWRQQTSIFKEVAAYDFAGPGFNLTGGSPEQVHGFHVTEGYFRLFGAPVMLGRTFTAQEDLPNGGKVVVLSYGLWQRNFGGDPKIVGTSLSLGNEPYTIVGVLGRSFQSDPEAEIWLPFQFDPNSTNLGDYFNVAGMLKPGVTLAQANAQMKIASQQFHRDWPIRTDQFAVEPLHDRIVGNVRSSLLVLLGAVGLVLLIACANVANLLLARATGRKREFAIRSALGAGRARILRQLLTESVLLSVAGGALGLLLGYEGVRVLHAISPAGLPRIGENGAAVGIDWRVLCFTIAVSLFTGILFGLFPALNASRLDPNSALKDTGNRSGTGFQQSKARSLLVISEVSLAMVLLIGSALLIRTFIALRAVNPGIDTHSVLTLQMSLTGDRYQKTAGVAQLSREGRERLNAIPSVEASASACCLPLGGAFSLPFNIVGRPLGKEAQTGVVGWMNASPGYFSVLKTPVLLGRDFTDSDIAGAPGVVLINQAMAKQFWPNQNPVGQQMILGVGLGSQFEEPVRQIIGVVGDIHDSGLNRDPRPMMIVPEAQVTDGMTAINASIGPVDWIVRTHGDPHQVVAAVTEQLRLASGGFPVAHVRLMDEIVVRSTARDSFNMLLLTIFGAVALAVAAIGIYGLMAYSVEQRRQEMGIRLALGADRFDVLRLILKEGMRLTTIGILCGLVLSFAATRVLAGLLYGIKPRDPLTFAAVSLFLGAVAFISCYVPALRAASIDPMKSLRAE